MIIEAKITIPEDIALSIRGTVEGVELEAKRALAITYYKEKRLSLGQCTQLAQMSKYDFVKLLSEYSISIFDLDEKELMEDVDIALRYSK